LNLSRGKKAEQLLPTKRGMKGAKVSWVLNSRYISFDKETISIGLNTSSNH